MISAYRSISSAKSPIFLESLEGLLNGAPTRDSIVLLGDFDAHVGNDSDTWRGMIGGMALLIRAGFSGLVAVFFHKEHYVDEKHYVGALDDCVYNTRQNAHILSVQLITLFSTEFLFGSVHQPHHLPCPS